MFYKSKFQGKRHELKSLVNRVADLQTCNSIIKGLWYKCFPVEFLEIFKNTYFQEHTRTTAFEICLFIWTALFEFFSWYLYFSICIIIYSFDITHLQILAQSCLCEFWEISHNTFLKKPSNGCLCIKTSSIYCSTTTFHFFKNDFKRIFELSIFSG